MNYPIANIISLSSFNDDNISMSLKDLDSKITYENDKIEIKDKNNKETFVYIIEKISRYLRGERSLSLNITDKTVKISFYFEKTEIILTNKHYCNQDTLHDCVNMILNLIESNRALKNEICKMKKKKFNV